VDRDCRCECGQGNEHVPCTCIATRFGRGTHRVVTPGTAGAPVFRVCLVRHVRADCIVRVRLSSSPSHRSCARRTRTVSERTRCCCSCTFKSLPRAS
jgi:hypothetical protein